MVKKIASRLLALFLAALPISVTLGGCSLTTFEGPEIDETKTQLEIGNMDKGLGDEWLDAVSAKFEEAYADYPGENGKVGVQVIVTNKHSEFSTSSLVANMPYNDLDLYVVAESSYATLYMKQYEGESILADLSEVVNAKNYDDEGNLAADGTGTQSIASRMAEAYQNYYDISSDGSGSYYALPFFCTATGGVYDADYFDEAALYFYEDGVIGATQEDIENGNCGPGPDGRMGTYDDGMPETWEQFMELMNAIVATGDIPFIWDGLNDYERKYFFQQLYANYEGANDYSLLYSLSGTDSQFGEINEENGYLLAGQEGRLAANKAISDIMSNASYYSEDAMKSSTTHTNAQMLYLKSIEKNQRIAMFMEGSWWENEAREVFDDMALTEESWGHGKRNFKILPMPNFEGTTLATAERTGGSPIVSAQKDDRQVMVMSDADGSALFVSNQAPHKDLAMEFVKFIHSRDMLALTTQVSSVIRPFEYGFTEEEMADCTPYTQSILTMMNDEYTDVIWGRAGRNSIVENNAQLFQNWLSEEVFTTYFNGGDPYSVFLASKSYYENNWPNK